MYTVFNQIILELYTTVCITFYTISMVWLCFSILRVFTFDMWICVSTSRPIYNLFSSSYLGVFAYIHLTPMAAHFLRFINCWNVYIRLFFFFFWLQHHNNILNICRKFNSCSCSSSFLKSSQFNWLKVERYNSMYLPIELKDFVKFIVKVFYSKILCLPRCISLEFAWYKNVK